MDAVVTWLECAILWLNTNAGFVTGVATIFIAAFTFVLMRATIRMYEHAARSERAYVKILHKTGLITFEDLNEARVTLNVTNCGRTPADVTDVAYTWLTFPKDRKPPKEMPAIKVGDDGDGTSAFLVVNDSFKFLATLKGFPSGFIDDVENGRQMLWVIAYVDYKDAFGRRFRSGYARQYDPSVPRRDQIAPTENLTFVRHDNCNYDRKRKKGEGRDW